MQEAAHALSARARDVDHISLACVADLLVESGRGPFDDARQEA
jgi:hypothetical protein